MAVSAIIRVNKSLLRCNLSHNSMSETVGQNILISINLNDLIELLDVTHNLISGKFLELIAVKCERNRAENQKLKVPMYQ